MVKAAELLSSALTVSKEEKLDNAMDKLLNETPKPLFFDISSIKAIKSVILGVHREANDLKMQLAEEKYKVSKLKK